MLWDNSALLVLFIVTPPSWETHLPSMGLHVSAPAWSLVNDTNDAAPWPKIIGASISTWIRFSCEFIVSKKPPCVDGSVACKPVEILAHCKLLILCWLERRLGKKERAVWERGKKERERGKRNREKERGRERREKKEMTKHPAWNLFTVLLPVPKDWLNPFLCIQCYIIVSLW